MRVCLSVCVCVNAYVCVCACVCACLCVGLFVFKNTLLVISSFKSGLLRLN